MKKQTGFLIAVLLLGAAGALAADSVKSLAGVSFSIPQAWTETPPSSEMRAFQFSIPGAKGENGELAVFHFGPGMGGDIQSNVNRWKAQFTLLAGEKTEEKKINGITVTVVSLRGTYQLSGGPMMMAQGEPIENYAMLGAIISAPEGFVFLKATGPASVLDNASAAFDQMISSLHS